MNKYIYYDSLLIYMIYRNIEIMELKGDRKNN